MSIPRFIFVVSTPFSLRDYERYGVERLISDGFSVEIWNIGRIANRFAYDATRSTSARLGIEFEFTAKGQVWERLQETENSFFFVAVPYSFNTLFLFRMLSRTTAVIGISVAYPASSIASTTRSKKTTISEYVEAFLSKISKLTRKSFLDKITMSFSPVFLGARYASVVFYGGAKSNFRHPLIGATTERVAIHVNDYDSFLKLPPVENIQSPYAVFIDQNLPFNSDPLYTKTPRVVSKDIYYQSVTAFFDKIEVELQMPVKVAAHPRLDLNKCRHLFGGREVSIGNTADLIRNSTLVLAHYSYAVNFAVLYAKPILFITTNELRASFRQAAVDTLADHLGKMPINIDEVVDLQSRTVMEINDKAYQHYIHDFIKVAATPERPFWDVVADFVKSSTRKF